MCTCTCTKCSTGVQCIPCQNCQLAIFISDGLKNNSIHQISEHFNTCIVTLKLKVFLFFQLRIHEDELFGLNLCT